MMNHEAFKNFMDRYKRSHGLSVRKFESLSERQTLSRSTINRLRGNDKEISPRFLQQIKPIVIGTLTEYLTDVGKTADEISHEIKLIFEDFTPMITERTALSFEAIDFFGFDRDPFALESDPRTPEETYTNSTIDRVFRRLEDAISFQGFIAVLGEIGAGKSTLKSRLLAKYRDGKKVQLLFPKFAEMAVLDPSSIVYFFLDYFGQPKPQRRVQAQRNLEALLKEFNDRGTHVCLGIDECHRLSDKTLTALKNFYELGTGGYERYLGLMLMGQPQFEQRLLSAGFREIAERLEIVRMPSTAKFAKDYMGHRLELVGADVNKLFDAGAIKAIAAQVGTPLGIGNLANKALNDAAKAMEKQITARFVSGNDKGEPRVTAIRKAR